MTPTVSNQTINVTAVPHYLQLTYYCPLTDDDIENGWTIYDLPDSCLSLLEKYCDPPANATIPTSTTLPRTCSPAYYLSSASSTTNIASRTSISRAPTQTGIAANCKWTSSLHPLSYICKSILRFIGDAFYVVKSNDTCQGIVTDFGNFTLDQFYGWNPAVRSSCSHLETSEYPLLRHTSGKVS